MTDANYSAICLLIDRSGSMSTIQKSAQDAIRGFVRGQRKASGKRTVRLVHFDDQYQVVHPSVDPKRSPGYSLVPRGMTALFDAMGKSITEFGEELSALPEDERPGTVVFAIMTDGMENSSQEFTQEQVNALVKQQTDDYAWQFVYLGANQDAIKVGEGLGISRDRSLTYTASSAGVHGMATGLENYVAAASAGRSYAFTDEDRENAED